MPRVDTSVLNALPRHAANDRDLRSIWLEKAYNIRRAWEHFGLTPGTPAGGQRRLF